MAHPDTDKALDRAHALAATWLGSLDDRPVPARAGAAAVADAETYTTAVVVGATPISRNVP